MSIWQDKDGYWHVAVARDGKRIHKRCRKGAPKAQAQELEAKIIRDLWEMKHLGKKPDVLIAAAMAEYLKSIQHQKSGNTMKYHALRIAEWIDGQVLKDAPACAARITQELLDEGYARATVNRSLATLKRACNLAYKLGWASENYGDKIELLTEGNERHVYLTKDQIAHICTQDPEIADAVMIAAYTGLRLSELLSLGPVTGDAIYLSSKTKNGRARMIPVARAIREHVARLPIKMPRRTLQQRFKKAAPAGVRWHDLRHSTASLLVNAGVSLYVVGQILGHTTTQTTQRYAHLEDEAKRAAIDLIG